MSQAEEHALADVTPRELDPQDRALLDSALVKFAAVQKVNADHPSAHMNLGPPRARQGRFDEAERHYRKAIEPAFIPSYVNRADLKGNPGKEQEAEAVLRTALQRDPGFASARYALGLALVRTGRKDEALRELSRAAADAPENRDFAYACGVALNSAGNSLEAMRALEGALARRPLDRNLLQAAAAIRRDRGDTEAALRHAETPVRHWPDDAGAQHLYAGLAAAAGRR